MEAVGRTANSALLIAARGALVWCAKGRLGANAARDTRERAVMLAHQAIKIAIAMEVVIPTANAPRSTVERAGRACSEEGSPPVSAGSATEAKTA